MGKRLAAVAMVGMACAFAAPASSDEAPPRAIDLSGGFTPDPVVIDLTVLGERAADDDVRGCPGFVADSEALAVTLSFPSTPLRFYLRGGDMAALVMRGPDGIYRCAGVDANGIARVVMDRPLEGVHSLWPASTAAASAQEVAVLVTERDLEAYELVPFAMPTAQDLEPALLGVVAVQTQPADTGQQLAQGTLRGGVIDAARLVEGCPGGVDPTAADLTVTLAEALPALSLYAESGDDTVLLVLDPDGGWWCIDDAAGHNPAVTVAPAAAGRYQLLVAGFSADDGNAVTLFASPGEPLWSQDWSQSSSAPEVELGLGAEPVAGRYSLSDAGVVDVPLTLRSGVYASGYVVGCAGEIDPSQPDLVLTLAQHEPSLHVYVTSKADTALMVLTPDREAYCDDDTHGLHPEVIVTDAAPGNYPIWVALAAGMEGSDALAHLSREPPASLLGPGDTGAHADVESEPALLDRLIGRDFASAAAALAILVDETPLGERLAYQRIEVRGIEGFTLHDAVVRDPEGEHDPVAIARIDMDNLDLDGLRERGEPARFALRAEGIDYAALASDAQRLVPLPRLDDAPTASLAVSVLPLAEDSEQLRTELLARLDGQVALRVEILGSPPGDLLPHERSLSTLLAHSVDLELGNLGFLALVLAEQAATAGTSVEEHVAGMLNDLRELLAPVEPGSLHAQLLTALETALAAPARPGVLRLRFQSAVPRSVDALIELAMQESAPADESMTVSIEYLPLPWP